jgi:hypothetical protein
MIAAPLAAVTEKLSCAIRFGVEMTNANVPMTSIAFMDTSRTRTTAFSNSYIDQQPGLGPNKVFVGGFSASCRLDVKDFPNE